MTQSNTFSAPLMLSVSGARGIVGQSMTPEVAAAFAAAFGSQLRAALHVSHPSVVIGRDSRPSGASLQEGAIRGLLDTGCRVIRLGIQTTPGMAVALAMTNADGGIVITASHNPSQWNGLKCLVAPGCAPARQVADDIIRRFRERTASGGSAPREGGLCETMDDQTVIDAHIRRVLESIDPEPIRAAGLTVVLDSVNGAGGPPARKLLEAIGVQIIPMNVEPTGVFVHEPEPIEQNLTALASAVSEQGADIGFAQDPDADRLAVVDNTGRYIGEEYTLVLAARCALENGLEPARARVAVTNLSTSRMIDDVAGAAGALVLRTPVGEANVSEVMQREQAVIGGEGNGGVVWPPVCLVRDSLSAMALILSYMASRHEKLRTLVNGMKSYVIRKAKVGLRNRDDAANVIAALADAYSDQRRDLQDGLRIDWPDQGCWLHVRPSNTEPIMRVIAEGPTEADVDRIMNAAVSVVGPMLR